MAGIGFDKALTPTQEFADEYPYFFSLSVTLNEWVDRQKQGLYNRWILGEKGFPVFGSDIEKARKELRELANKSIRTYLLSATLSDDVVNILLQLFMKM